MIVIAPIEHIASSEQVLGSNASDLGTTGLGMHPSPKRFLILYLGYLP